MKVKLEVFKGPERGKVFVLDEPTTCVAGRSKEARFRFSKDDPYISRRHFILEVAPPKVYFRDLDVTNSSKINDRYVDEAELADSDIIEVGYTKLKLSLNLDIQTKTSRCKKCGKTFDIYNDEDPVQFCADCAKELEAKKQRKAALKNVQAALQIKCKCGQDLSESADSDGRAQELMGKVTYCCENCLPRKGKDGDKKITNYEVIKKLGEGGMGKVYLAFHKPTSRLVVLKEINIFNRHLAARFDREIRIMKNMIHENVLYYIDSGQDKKTGKPYLVMEYASLGSLDDLLIKKAGALAPKVAVQYIVSSLKGLEFIHNKGIVHRDIKPENILLKGNGQSSSSPKITDFGLARQFSKAGGSVLTKLGQGMGTLLYMPPEQIRDAHRVREPADLYSMGVTLYHLLTGKYPFNFPTPLDIRKFLRANRNRLKSPGAALRLMMEVQKLKTPHLIVLTEQPIPIKKRKPDIPSDLARIVDKAIRKDISQRFQNAVDFRNELESIVSRL